MTEALNHLSVDKSATALTPEQQVSRMLNTLKANPVALAIRQPFCDWILSEGKDIENRDWVTQFRGPFLIHASKAIFPEYRARVRERKLNLGGIVGMAEIIDCVEHSDSKWFNGTYGFVLRNMTPLEFVPSKGRLKFFRPNIDPELLKCL